MYTMLKHLHTQKTITSPEEMLVMKQLHIFELFLQRFLNTLWLCVLCSVGSHKFRIYSHAGVTYERAPGGTDGHCLVQRDS